MIEVLLWCRRVFQGYVNKRFISGVADYSAVEEAQYRNRARGPDKFNLVALGISGIRGVRVGDGRE